MCCVNRNKSNALHGRHIDAVAKVDTNICPQVFTDYESFLSCFEVDDASRKVAYDAYFADVVPSLNTIDDPGIGVDQRDHIF